MSTSVALVVPPTAGATASFEVALNEVGYEWKSTVELQVDSDPAATVAEPRALTFTAGERRCVLTRIMLSILCMTIDHVCVPLYFQRLTFSILTLSNTASNKLSR